MADWCPSGSGNTVGCAQQIQGGNVDCYKWTAQFVAYENFFFFNSFVNPEMRLIPFPNSAQDNKVCADNQKLLHKEE